MMLSVDELRDLVWMLRRVVVHGEHAERLIQLEARLQQELHSKKARQHAA
jgi:hypothetical protein